MNRDEFCRYHWDYYLVLERDFLETERYVSFDLGDNYLYDGKRVTDFGNSKIYSNEYVKQYQAICSEIDVIMKTICFELGNINANNMVSGYTPTILNEWKQIRLQKVKMKNIELQPFVNWKADPYKAPDWWPAYNKVKHERVDNFKKANLKNVINALAGLYVLESYLARHIGEKNNDVDVPNDVSKVFELVDFITKNRVIAKNTYLVLVNGEEKISMKEWIE